MIVMIDNYDSFVYNLVHLFEMQGQSVVVYRNDAITLEAIESLNPQAIIISPGPCTPDEAGISCDVIRHFSGKVPLLGICLGHQCIAQVFGEKVIRDIQPVHGKASLITHTGGGLFAHMPESMAVGRYHSLIVKNIPEDSVLEATAFLESNPDIIMALQHKKHLTFGVQFHPESILTENGHTLIQNFINIAESKIMVDPSLCSGNNNSLTSFVS